MTAPSQPSLTRTTAAVPPTSRPSRLRTIALILVLVVTAGVLGEVAWKNAYWHFCYTLTLSDVVGIDAGADSLPVSRTAILLHISKDRVPLYPDKLDRAHQYDEFLAFTSRVDARYPSIQPRFNVFVYPPTLVSLLSLIAGIGTPDQFVTLWGSFTRLLVVLFPLLLFGLSPLRRRGVDGGPGAARRDLVDLVVITILAGLYFPLICVNYLTQTSVVVGACVAGFFVAYQRRNDWAAGLLLALAIHLKITPVFLVLWLVVRREWRVVIYTALFGLGLLGISLAVVGWKSHWKYVTVILPYLEQGSAFHPNRSLVGVLRRLDPAVDPRVFNHTAGPSWIPPIAKATLLLLLLGSFAACWVQAKRLRRAGRLAERRVPEIEASLFLLAALIASPVTWEHHCILLLPLFAAAWFGVRRGELRFPAWVSVLFVFCYFILALNQWPAAWGGGPTNRFTLAFPLFAMVVLWACIVAGLIFRPGWFDPTSATEEAGGATSDDPPRERYFLRIPRVAEYPWVRIVVAGAGFIAAAGAAFFLARAAHRAYGLTSPVLIGIALGFILYGAYGFFAHPLESRIPPAEESA